MKTLKRPSQGQIKIKTLHANLDDCLSFLSSRPEIASIAIDLAWNCQPLRGIQIQKGQLGILLGVTESGLLHVETTQLFKTRNPMRHSYCFNSADAFIQWFNQL